MGFVCPLLIKENTMYYVIINKFAPMAFSWNGTTTVPGQEAKFQTIEAAKKAVDWYREFPGNESATMEIVER
jgi:hypothetical protein